MEKLLNLLQEFYGENRKFSNDDGLLTMTNGVVNLSGAYAQTYIISKQGGFIKWLVENKKTYFEEADYKGRHFDGKNYEDLIMLLSVIDNPIEFLSTLFH